MKTVSRRLSFLAATLALLAGAHGQLAEEYRMWTNTAGKQVEATLVSVDATAKTVKIKMKDGREFDVPIASLSAADFEYAKARYAAMQAAPAPAPSATPPAATTATPPAPAPAPGKKTATAPVGPPAPPPPQFKTIPVKGFKGPMGSDFLRSVQKVRPRLLHTAQTWGSLKDQAAKDPVLGKILENLKKGGEDLLQKPELSKIFGTEKARGSAEGAQALYRMATLGVLHYVDGDPKWRERAVRELDLLTDSRSFGDWSPGPKDMALCADFTTAVALGYDWFRDGMNAAQQEKTRTYMVQKGMEPLAANLEGKPVPATARTAAPGTIADKADDKPTGKPVEKDDKLPPTKDEMAAAAALLMAAICLADDDANAAKKAADAVGKVFTRGVAAFAPSGIWHEGMEAGDEVLDSIAMVLQTMRVAGGGDMGLAYLEGMPLAGHARLHLSGPRGMFNYGDARGSALTHNWVATWLAGLHGNPGMNAVPAGSPPGATSAFLNLAGHFIYYNPWAGGSATAASLDAVFPGAEVAALRSAWNDPKAAYIALKGGDNEALSTQLDIGSFVLDLGGVRWATELGAEGDRIGGFEPNAADRSKRHAFYLASTAGQNTLVIGADEPPPPPKNPPAGAKPPPPPIMGNQPLDAKGAFIGHLSTPERGVAVLDMSDAYSSKVKTAHRGAMVVRGPNPYVLLQDDLAIKGTTDVEWNMHTQATIAVAGNKATLTQGDPAKGGQTLTAVLLSPEGASFTTAEPPEKPNEQARDLKSYHILKVKLAGAKGDQRIAVAFGLGNDAPAAPVTPVAQWLPKK